MPYYIRKLEDTPEGLAQWVMGQKNNGSVSYTTDLGKALFVKNDKLEHTLGILPDKHIAYAQGVVHSVVLKIVEASDLKAKAGLAVVHPETEPLHVEFDKVCKVADPRRPIGTFAETNDVARLLIGQYGVPRNTPIACITIEEDNIVSTHCDDSLDEYRKQHGENLLAYWYRGKGL